jgi:hypothetical protein
LVRVRERINDAIEVAAGILGGVVLDEAGLAQVFT